MNKEDFIGRPGGEQLDCSVRAFTVLTEKPYNEVHMEFANAGRKDKHRTPNKVTNMVVAKYKLKRIKCGLTVAKFLEDVKYIKSVAAVINGHAFGVKYGVIADYEKVKPRAIVKFYYVK